MARECIGGLTSSYPVIQCKAPLRWRGYARDLHNNGLAKCVIESLKLRENRVSANLETLRGKQIPHDDDDRGVFSMYPQSTHIHSIIVGGE